MKILMSGASGLIGRALVPFLIAKGHEVVKLVRRDADFESEELEGIEGVVHLAGESIMGRWTDKKKEKIRKSRVERTSLLCQALAALKRPPLVFIGASAIGFYGDRGDEILTEESAKGTGFLSDVCEEWERSTSLLKEKGTRIVHLRTGMVLSLQGGALKQMLPPFKLGLGGKLGTGKQWMSWIAIDDLIRIIEFALLHTQLEGALNAVAPYPVTNETFTITLGQALGRPTFMTVPAFAVKLLFGEMGEELLLSSQRIKPSKLEQASFAFAYPHLEEALQHLIQGIN